MTIQNNTIVSDQDVIQYETIQCVTSLPRYFESVIVDVNVIVIVIVIDIKIVIVIVNHNTLSLCVIHKTLS